MLGSRRAISPRFLEFEIGGCPLTAALAVDMMVGRTEKKMKKKKKKSILVNGLSLDAAIHKEKKIIHANMGGFIVDGVVLSKRQPNRPYKDRRVECVINGRWVRIPMSKFLPISHQALLNKEQNQDQDQNQPVARDNFPCGNCRLKFGV